MRTPRRFRTIPAVPGFLVHAAQVMLPPLGPGVEAEDVVTIEYWSGMLPDNEQWHQPAFDAAIKNPQHIATRCYIVRFRSTLEMLQIVAASPAAAGMFPKQAVVIYSDESYNALKPTLNELCVRSDAHTRVWVTRKANIPVNWCPYHCSAGRPPPHRPSIVRERPTAHCTRARARAPACSAQERRSENQGGASAGHFHRQDAPRRRHIGTCVACRTSLWARGGRADADDRLGR